MNLCGGYPGSRQVFRSYSTNNIDTKGSRRSVPLHITATDFVDRHEPFLKSKTSTKSILKKQDSTVPSTLQWASSGEGGSLRMTGHAYDDKPEQTTKPMKHSKSFNVSKLPRDETEEKKYKKFSLFDKKKLRFVNISECSEHENQRANIGKKMKPLLLRSLSSSCLSLAGKSRPKLINRLSCQDSLTPPDQITANLDYPHKVSEHGTRLRNPERTGDTHTSFKARHSREITRRDSQTLVTRFELELAITKDDRSKLLTFINSKTFDLNAKDYYGKTLLHTACSVGNYHCAQILINAGAQVENQDQAGFTPLHCAVVANHVPCAAVLIAAGADVMTSTRTLHTALTLAHEEEMILMIGRSLLLRGTQRKTEKDDDKYFSLRETKL